MAPILTSKLASAFIFTLFSVLLSHNFVLSTTSNDQKSYYSPDPHSGTPPTVSHKSPPHGGTPPSDKNCGTPPHQPTPTPSHPPHQPTPTPSNPPYGGGSPPTTPVPDPGTPSPPATPIIGTCNFWKTHPGMIWGMLGWWGTLGNAFGATNGPGFGANVNLLQALSNTRTDGFGALYREGTASYLNSLINARFAFTTKQVRESFVAALRSNGAASDQAAEFKLANEGKLRPRA